MSPAEPRVTVALPTCGRPQKLEASLGVYRRSTEPLRISVFDSMPDERNRESARRFDVDLVESPEIVGPAGARHALGERCETEFLLYSDDDQSPAPGGIETLVALMDRHPEVDIIGARLLRKDGEHPLTQTLVDGYRDGRRTVRKIFGYADDVADLELDLVETHITMPTVLLRRSVLSRVAFDPRYEFFFDLWDFGMQCRAAGVQCFAAPEAIFRHRPGGYGTTVTNRQVDKNIDLARFSAKWDIDPVGKTGPRAR